MQSYMAEHFAYEERMMERYAYPRLAEHRVQHQDLKRHYAELIDGGSAERVGQARKLIYTWFVAHVVGDRMDRDLGVFLRRIGVFLA